MTSKNRVILRIGGMDYAVRGSDSEEHIHKLGLYVDRKMNEIIRNNTKLSTNMAAVLTALNVADDFIKAKENGSYLLDEVNKIKDGFKSLEEENKRLKQENLTLKKINNNMQLDLVKRETELKEARNSLEKLTK